MRRHKRYNYKHKGNMLRKIKQTIIILGATAVLPLVSVPHSSALTYQQDIPVSFTFNSSIILTLSSADLRINNLVPGTASDSNIITVSATSNNSTGYVVTATVGDNTHSNPSFSNTSLNHKSNTGSTFTSLATNASLANITNDNTWGYTISDDGNTWANYSGLPIYTAEAGKTLKESNTNGTTSFQFKIAAKASNTQPSGEYNNVINFTVTSNPEPTLEPISCSGANKICYSANSLGTVEGGMGEQDATAGSTVTLLASNFSQAGYGFAGWSDAYDYATNANAHFYGPNEDITIPADMSQGLPLYAVWVPSAGNLQSWNGCSTMNTGNVTALTDQRDNNTYAVAKLADGNCWMIENLRLADKTTDNTPIAISSTNTNSPISTFTQLGASVDPTSTAWCTSNSAACDDQSMLFSGNTTNPATNMTASNTSTPVYSYGNYYNWYSATAGNGTYSTGSGVVAAGDICPAGWHLPYGGSGTGTKGGNTSGGFYYLNYKLNNDQNITDGTASNKLRSYPQNFVYSGYVTGTSIVNRSSGGSYWSSTAYGSVNAYNMLFYSSNVNPGANNYNKYSGRMARCMVTGS